MLLPVCASVLIGGWLTFQGLVVWVVLSREEIVPTPEWRPRLSVVPADPRPGDTIDIHFDWGGVDERYERARCAVTYDLRVQPDGPLPAPEYRWIPRGETPSWTIPEGAARITLIGLQPSRCTPDLVIDFDR